MRGIYFFKSQLQHHFFLSCALVRSFIPFHFSPKWYAPQLTYPPCDTALQWSTWAWPSNHDGGQQSDPKLWNSACASPLITNCLSFRCVWTWMTHGLRNTAGSSMCKCEGNIVREVWDWQRSVYVFNWEYTCRGGIRWSPSPPGNWETKCILKQ